MQCKSVTRLHKDVYNTGKVKIGYLYEPSKRVEMSADEELIQFLLIGKTIPLKDRAMPWIWALAIILFFYIVWGKQ